MECESKSDARNNRGDWNHFKITHAIPEQRARRAWNLGTAYKRVIWDRHTYCGKYWHKKYKTYFTGEITLHHHHHHHHHMSVMELGYLLARSGLTYLEVSSEVFHDSFCHLGNSVSLSWVVCSEALHYITCSTHCEYRTTATLYTIETWFFSGI